MDARRLSERCAPCRLRAATIDSRRVAALGIGPRFVRGRTIDLRESTEASRSGCMRRGPVSRLRFALARSPAAVCMDRALHLERLTVSWLNLLIEDVLSEYPRLPPGVQLGYLYLRTISGQFAWSRRQCVGCFLHNRTPVFAKRFRPVYLLSSVMKA